MSRSPNRHFAEKITLFEWSSLHAYLIWIYDGPVALAAGSRVSFSSPYLTAWLIRAGSLELRVGNRKVEASPGEWLFPPPGPRSAEVSRRFSSDARVLSVKYRACWPSGEELFADGPAVKLNAQEHPELERNAKPLVQFVARHYPQADTHLLELPATLSLHLELQCHFMRWLHASVCAVMNEGLVPARMGHIDARLLRAVQAIERHNLQDKFCAAALAGRAGLCVSHLNRLFGQRFGLSSRSYFERRRIEHAKVALRGSRQPIKEIAFQLGFSSLQHFSAWTRKHLGSAPSVYRELHPIEHFS